jgi:hypothetical protein
MVASLAQLVFRACTKLTVTIQHVHLATRTATDAELTMLASASLGTVLLILASLAQLVLLARTSVKEQILYAKCVH